MPKKKTLPPKTLSKSNTAKNKKPPTKTPEQKREAARQRNHAKALREMFEGAGFTPIAELQNTTFVFKQKMCDFDRVYVLENIVVLVEETYTGVANLSDHLEGKKTIFDYINSDTSGFASYMRGNFPSLSKAVPSKYHDHQVQFRIVYSALNRLKDSAKKHVKNVYYLDFHILRYFQQLARTARRSSVFEVLSFLGVPPSKYGENVTHAKLSSTPFAGSVLPSLQSHFPAGFKVVSFYASAARLIERSYVLRKNSWRDNSGAYQRPLSSKKVGLIRRFILGKSGVFVNNIIATLPPETRFEDEAGNQVDPATIKDVQAIHINLPNAYNSVGLIDGQHRVFSYYEGGPDEADILPLRNQQNLLVTGIVFPASLSEIERERFAARLFLQINSRQAKPPPELTQEIDVLLRPNAATSIARRILNVLNLRGPLEGEFVSPLSEAGRIRTASVVNYGLIYLVRPTGNESLFSQWGRPDKEALADAKPDDISINAILDEYVDYCVVEINRFVGAVKVNLPAAAWKPLSKEGSGLLSVTFVNGLLHALRKIAAAGKLAEADDYRNAFKDIGQFKFSGYTSSSYSDMGAEIAHQFFGVPKVDAISTGPSDL